MVQVDNDGAIFMVENIMNSQRMKHVDIWYHFVQEFVEDGYIKIIFMKTTENPADMFMKNMGSSAYNEHASDFVGTRADMGISKKELCDVPS